MKEYTTLIEAINNLNIQGYSEDFNLKQNCLECRNGEYKILHDEFHIYSTYRFEGDTDLADEYVVYAIFSTKYQLKGTSVNGYGIYTESITDDLLKALQM